MTGFHEIHPLASELRRKTQLKRLRRKKKTRKKPAKQNLEIKKTDILNPRKSIGEKEREILE